MQVDDLVNRLQLLVHPEGGWYREVYRNESVSTIHYVMAPRALAPLHRVHERVELWHFYGGAPLELHTIVDGAHAVATLGPEAPIAVVPPGAWQAARTGDGAAWCGCTVAPAFDFAAWEMPARAALLETLPAPLHAIVRELTRA